MAFILLNTTNEQALKTIRRWISGHRRTQLKDNDWLIRKLGAGTYLFDANGAILALLLDLRKRYNGDVYIYAVQPLHENEFPKNVRKEVNECLNKKVYLTQEKLEELSKTKLDYSANLKEI
jgi:hypothetical protein